MGSTVAGRAVMSRPVRKTFENVLKAEKKHLVVIKFQELEETRWMRDLTVVLVKIRFERLHRLRPRRNTKHGGGLGTSICGSNPATDANTMKSGQRDQGWLSHLFKPAKNTVERIRYAMAVDEICPFMGKDSGQIKARRNIECTRDNVEMGIVVERSRQEDAICCMAHVLGRRDFRGCRHTSMMRQCGDPFGSLVVHMPDNKWKITACKITSPPLLAASSPRQTEIT
ncbi:hypothetical protein B0H13DRAFT_1908156 [Mycena leptocephala]|nr:hypothetical protein B0H13DRAFT_1908156 [Mycena leptocephala]